MRRKCRLHIEEDRRGARGPLDSKSKCSNFEVKSMIYPEPSLHETTLAVVNVCREGVGEVGVA